MSTIENLHHTTDHSDLTDNKSTSLSLLITNNLYTLKIHLILLNLGKAELSISDKFPKESSVQNRIKAIETYCAIIQKNLYQMSSIVDYTSCMEKINKVLLIVNQKTSIGAAQLIPILNTLTDLQKYWNDTLRNITLSQYYNNDFDKIHQQALIKFLEIKQIFHISDNLQQDSLKSFYGPDIENLYTLIVKENSFNNTNTPFKLELDAILKTNTLETTSLFHTEEFVHKSHENSNFSMNKVRSSAPSHNSESLSSLDAFLSTHNIPIKNSSVMLSSKLPVKTILQELDTLLPKIDMLQLHVSFSSQSNNDWDITDVITCLNKHHLHPIQFLEPHLYLKYGNWKECKILFVQKHIIEELSLMISLQKSKSREVLKCSKPSCGTRAWL